MPFFTNKSYNKMIEHFNKSNKHPLVPFLNDEMRNPVLFPIHFLKKLKTIKGDMGAKKLIIKNKYNKIKIRKRDCNIIRNKIFVNKYGYGMLLSNKPTSYFTKNYITNNAVFLLRNTSLNNEEKKEIIKKSIINIELDHPVGNQNIKCKGALNQVPLN